MAEEQYTVSLARSFSEIREIHDGLLAYLHARRVEFADFLTRPDAKQEFVAVFQQAYNSIPRDMRDVPEVKAELHMRAIDLRSTLLDICDTRSEENEAVVTSDRANGFLEDQLTMMMNLFIGILKAEQDRYVVVSRNALFVPQCPAHLSHMRRRWCV
jgi:hypothetical protein